MNAPDSFATLLARTRESFPASTKSFITGSRADLRVPVRDIALTNGEVVSVYDTSGPYTDPAAIIDVKQGLQSVRGAPGRILRRAPGCTFGRALHMLRYYVGDEAFYTALNLYLTRHAYKSVEVHDLRLAFEEVTGEDLNWFFNQWFLDDGHPTLSYSTDFDESSKSIKVSLNQTQKKIYPAAFVFPIDVDFHLQNGTIERKRIWMNERSQDFSFSMNSKPLLTLVDPNRILLVEWDEPALTTEEYQKMWKSCNSLQLKLNALGALTEDKE